MFENPPPTLENGSGGRAAPAKNIEPTFSETQSVPERRILLPLEFSKRSVVEPLWRLSGIDRNSYIETIFSVRNGN